MARARDANFHLGCLVKAYEDCVAVQGSPREVGLYNLNPVYP
jgi:hypothetical protein